jgi:hypothetical protein
MAVDTAVLVLRDSAEASEIDALTSLVGAIRQTKEDLDIVNVVVGALASRLRRIEKMVSAYRLRLIPVER